MVPLELYSQKPTGKKKKLTDTYSMWCAAEPGTGEVCVKCDYRGKKNSIIKRSDFGWKFESNLLTWRAAKSALIHSRGSRTHRLRRLPGVTEGYKELDYERHA